MIAAPIMFVCQVVAVHDGDGPIHCADGTKIRVAGIQAPDYENAEPCRTRRVGYVCSDRLADRSRAIVSRMVLRQALTCQPVGQSYSRVVARCRFADGRDLSCAILAAGAATRWDSYWRRYRMPGCRIDLSP